eukprot:SAG11_NODE_30488_length_300_cov_1.184080_1_plen_56_part_01
MSWSCIRAHAVLLHVKPLKYCSFNLSPTYKNVNNKFSVKYYLNLVLIDGAQSISNA